MNKNLSREIERLTIDLEFKTLVNDYSPSSLEQFRGVIRYASVCRIISDEEWNFLYDAAMALKDE